MHHPPLPHHCRLLGFEVLDGFLLMLILLDLQAAEAACRKTDVSRAMVLEKRI
jgi:hypothetical protein